MEEEEEEVGKWKGWGFEKIDDPPLKSGGLGENLSLKSKHEIQVLERERETVLVFLCKCFSEISEFLRFKFINKNLQFLKIKMKPIHINSELYI